MDQYGTFTFDDAPTLANLLFNKNNIYFAFSPNQLIAYRIIITTDYIKLGDPLSGGFHSNYFLIGIEHFGLYSFNLLERNNDFHPTYIAEKLNMRLADAEPIAKLFNLISGELTKLKTEPKNV